MKQKQESSILQWASIVLDERVSNINAIQDVRTVKKLLWHIDPEYFGNWEEGHGNESYSHVMEAIGKYFRDIITTDITHVIETLNVFKNSFEIWELLLCIAIKGKNKSDNINLILVMESEKMAELAGIVTAIIDRFGKTSAIERDQNLEQNGDKEQPESTEREYIIQLLQSIEQLENQVNQLNSLKNDNNLLEAAKRQAEETSKKLNQQRMQFLHCISSINRVQSKISFISNDEDYISVNSNTSLPQIGNEIVQFVQQNRKRLSHEIEKKLKLEEQIKYLRNNFNKYTEQIESKLIYYRQENQKLQIENETIVEEHMIYQQIITSLKNEKQQLQSKTINLKNSLERKVQVKANEDQIDQIEQEKKIKQYNKRKERLKNTNRNSLPNYKEQNGNTVNDDSIIMSINHDQPQERNGYSLKKQVDQVKQPILINNLKRENLELQAAIIGLNRKNEALRKANETMHDSTKCFMDSNQKIIDKWEDQYQVLLQKMAKLTEMKEFLKTEQKTQTQPLLQQNRQSQIPNQEDQEKSNSIDSRSNSQKQSQNQEDKIIEQIQPSIQQDNIQRIALWEQIVNRFKQMIKEGKTREQSYELSIHQLKAQNTKLMQIMRNRHTKPKEDIQKADQFHIKIIKVEQESRLSKDEDRTMKVEESEKAQLVVYKDIVQSGQLLQTEINQRLTRIASLQQSSYSRQHKFKSQFYQNSILENECPDKLGQILAKQDVSKLHEQLYLEIKSNLEGLGKSLNQRQQANSEEIQTAMQSQMNKIQNQYRKLNQSYHQVFDKLNIYTQRLKSKQSTKQEYEKIIKEINTAQQGIKANHDAEIVKLRVINQALMGKLSQNAIQKDQILMMIEQLAKNIHASGQRQESTAKIIFKSIENMLRQTQCKYTQSIKDPLNFLQSCLEGSKQESQTEKIYKMFVKQRQKTKRLNEQLELLSSVLLQYRNMIEI